MIVDMYSITDKQKYIFSFPKLKDNVGASVMIDAVFSNITKKIIKELGGLITWIQTKTMYSRATP